MSYQEKNQRYARKRNTGISSLFKKKRVGGESENQRVKKFVKKKCMYALFLHFNGKQYNCNPLFSRPGQPAEESKQFSDVIWEYLLKLLSKI